MYNVEVYTFLHFFFFHLVIKALETDVENIQNSMKEHPMMPIHKYSVKCMCIYRPLLYQAICKSGFFFWTMVRTSSSRSLTFMLAIWLKNAQPNGVANINTKPTRLVWIGAFAHGNLIKNPRLANAWTTTGVMAKKSRTQLHKKHLAYACGVFLFITYPFREMP